MYRPNKSNTSILTRGWATVCGLVLLAGCTATRSGSASPSGRTSTADASGVASETTTTDATTTAASEVALRSAVLLPGASTPGATSGSTSGATAGPAATPARSSATTASSAVVTTPPVTATRTVEVTGAGDSSSDSSVVVTTTAPPALTYPCPTPAQVNTHGSNLRTAVECFDSNRWLVTSGVYGSGDPVDGIGIVHQTSPGVYQTVGGGSDFYGDEDHLKSEGLPDDLIDHLAEGKALAHQTRYDHPLADFLLTWERHTSELVLRDSGSGVMHLGSGCCNSISLPLTLSTDDYDGVLMATVSGPATYVGTGLSSVQVAVGTLVVFHFEKGANGPVLISTDPTGQRGGPLVWCGADYDSRCGA